MSIEVVRLTADPDYEHQYFSINIPYKGDANIIEKNMSDGLFYNGWISEGLTFNRGYPATREEPAEYPCYEPDGDREIEISGWSLTYIEYDDPNIATVKWNDKRKAYEMPLDYDELTDSKTLSKLLNINYDDLLKLENICKEKALKEIEGSWFYTDSDGNPGEEIR